MTDPNTTLGGTPKPEGQRTQTVKAQFAKMPPEKKRSQFWQKVTGGLLGLFGFYIVPTRWPAAPWWVSFAFVLAGGVALGGELVQYPFRRLIALGGDALDRYRKPGGPGTNGGG